MKKNRKEIIIFILSAIFIFSQIIGKTVNNLDEMWNFNFSNCIANGLLPYKDFNMIIGPLGPVIGAIFLKIFGQEMIVIRLLAVIFDSLILVLVYRILDKLKVKDFIKFGCLILLCYIMKSFFTFDYNWLMLLLVLVLINIELRKIDILDKTFSWKKELLIGIIVGLSITIKQTIGMVLILASVFYKILEIRKKNEIKDILKSVGLRALGALIVILSFIAILLKLNILNDYIDYCIMGISTFSNKVSYINELIKNKNIIIKILSIIPIPTYMLLTIIYVKNSFFKNIENNNKRNNRELIILLVYSLVQMIVVYPISDVAHFVLAIVPTVICVMLIINRISINTKIEVFLNNFIKCFGILYVIVFGIIGIKNLKNENINYELNHFKYLPLSSQEITNVKNVENYILSKEDKVYILDATAAYYMIPINRYNKNFDMFNNGNFGARGEQGQIDDLKNIKNKIILIRNDNYQRNWQNPEKVRKYVINQMKKIDQIGIFDVYQDK